MISQNCPVCHSSRIRRGYKHTYFWSKIFFRYHLLCDNCNWEFVGFALLFGQDSKSKKRKKTNTAENNSGMITDGNSNNEMNIVAVNTTENQKKIKRRTRVKI